MYLFGHFAADAARAFLDYVHAISPAMIGGVENQIGEQGLVAVMLGPLRGVP